MKKKVLSIILSGVLLIGNVPVTIYADNTGGIEQKVADELVIVDEEGKELESPFYLDVGDSEQFTLKNSAGKVENAKWSVQFPNVLEISENGQITAKASGDTMVYAEDEQGNKVSLRVSTGVAVEEINFPDKVTVGKIDFVTLHLRDNIFLGHPFSVYPEYQGGMENWNEIRLKSDNDDLIKSTGSSIYSNGYGTANLTLTITAKSGTTVTKNIQVEVKNIVTDILIDPIPEALEVGETKTLSVRYFPDDADLSDVKFESSNPEILEVDNTGKITAKKGGVATITVSSGVVKSSVEIEVIGKVESLEVEESEINMSQGDSYSIWIDYLPKDGYTFFDEELLNVSSSDDSIVRIEDIDSDRIKVFACGAGDAEISIKYDDLPEQKVKVHVEKYIPELDHFDVIPKNPVLYIGDTTEVEVANIWPEDAEVDKSKIKWEARNPEIATIDENGTVTAVAIGNASFNVYYDGREIDTFDVKVVDQNEEKVTLNIDGIHEGNKLYVGAEYYMDVESLFPYKEIKVKSSDESIIKVSDVLHPGNRFAISPKKVGKTTLTATVDGESKTIEIEVIELNEITLDRSSVSGVNNAETLYVGKPISFWLCDNGSVSNIPEYSFRVQSNTPSIVEAKIVGDDRLDLTPKKVGTATITITCNEDPRKKLVINSTVKEYVPIEELKFDQELVYMNVGDTFTQKVNVTPTNGTIWGQATYGSSARYIATVDEKTGEVTAKAPGTVQIMYLLPEAPNKTAGYTVVVRDKDDDSGEGSGGGTIIISPNDQPTVDLSKNGLNLKVGESVDVTATVKNSSKPVKWESSNPDCVEVSDGKITALHQGIAVVTAKSGTAVGFCLVVVEGDELNGWQQDKVSKKWYYLENGKAQTGWIKEDGEYYYCDSKNSGAMTENKWIVIEEEDPYNNNKVGEVWYRVDENGKMQTGWISDPEAPWKIYLLDTNGRMMHSDWVNAPENQDLNRPAGMYYLTDDGAVQMNGWTLAKNSNSVYWYCNPGTGLFESGNPNSWAGKKLW